MTDPEEEPLEENLDEQLDEGEPLAEDDSLEPAPWKLKLRSLYHGLLEKALGNQMVMYGVVLFVGTVLGGLAIGVAPRPSLPPEPETEGDVVEVIEEEVEKPGEPVEDEAPANGDEEEEIDEELEGEIERAKHYLGKGEYQHAVAVLEQFARSEEDRNEDDLIVLYSCLVEAFRGLDDQEQAGLYARKMWELVERGGEVVQRLSLAREAFEEKRYREARMLFYRFLCLSGGTVHEFMPGIEEAYFRVGDCLSREVDQRREPDRDEVGS